MGSIHRDLNVIRNCRKSLLHLTMLTSIVAATALNVDVASVEKAPSIHDTHTRRLAAIPFCDDKDHQERTIGRRFLYVTTLDGRISALDIAKGGKLRWSVPTGPGPLLSSNIHRLELTNNGQVVRLIPSLSGGIYKFDGDSIDQVPITTENMLSSSTKFSDDLIISGGKETRSYGISARTGQLLYECSMHGCVNSTEVPTETTTSTRSSNKSKATHPRGEGSTDNTAPPDDYLKEHDPQMDDVIVVRRQTQTVRAVESRTGIERWNFSVGQHDLDMVKSSECYNGELSDMDVAILDLDIKVIVPEGVVCAFNKADPKTLLWKYKFDHPIVSSWKISGSDELEAIDMFASAQWLWDNDENMFDSSFPSISPSIYLGMYEKQLYIQESITLRKDLTEQSNLYSHLATESRLPIIPWRPIPATSSSLMIIQNDNVISGNSHSGNGQSSSASSAPEGSQSNDLMPYNQDSFALSARSVLNASEYVNGNGFYFFRDSDLEAEDTDEIICDSEDLEDKESSTDASKHVKNIGNETNRTASDDLGFSLDDIDAPVKVVILSLWFWWKEIVVIALTTALLVNFLMSQRQRPEVVVIERHVPVPTAIEATEASTVALLGPTTGSSKSTSNGLSLANGHRTLSESTSCSGDHFSSRFLDDFELLRCLGRGGFGVVFEAKNKLDDCKYAVKRITLPNKKESRDRVLREVKTLANCEHQNIVRYFQAWVETPPPGWQEEEDSKWLAHEMSTSIQIETPDGTTFPSFDSGLPLKTPPKGKLLIEKKKQLLSWVSSITDTACSSDHEISNCIDEDNEDEDSCVIFRSESQSLALREIDEEEEQEQEEKEEENDDAEKVVKLELSSHQNNTKNAITPSSSGICVDIPSNLLELPNQIDFNQLSDSFQIEFVRSANGDVSDEDEDGDDDDDDDDADAIVVNGKTKNETDIQKANKRKQLSLNLNNNNNNKNHSNNNCKDLLPAGQQQQQQQQHSPKSFQNKVYLYIQMQLCRKESLRDWLRENKLEAREDNISSIFYQIVDAVEYVHEKGLIHRDLKPSNIFFSQDGQIKIGDFGLVTDMSDIPNMVTKCGDHSGLPSCSRHTQQVGTHLYMSPEQLRGYHYDYKVDVYSLGLIFFELLVFFNTEMERIHTLRALRDGRYPKEFPVEYPREYELLKLMLSQRPEERPPTKDLKPKLAEIFKLPDLKDDTEAVTLAVVATRLSRSRTFSSSE